MEVPKLASAGMTLAEDPLPHLITEALRAHQTVAGAKPHTANKEMTLSV